MIIESAFAALSGARLWMKSVLLRTIVLVGRLYVMLPAPIRQRIALAGLLPILMASSAFALARYAWCIPTNPDRAWLIALAEDRKANVAANGELGETISSRANRARSEGRRWGCMLCRLLDAIQSDHCRNSAKK